MFQFLESHSCLDQQQIDLRIIRGHLLYVINSLPNDKILAGAKFKAFADDKINVTEYLKFVLGTAENIVGKGENAGYQQFLLSHIVFQRVLLHGG